MQESATRTILSVSGESVKIQDVSKTARKTAKCQSVQMGKTQPFASASGYFSCRIVIPDDINALRLVVGNPAALQVVTHADWHSALFLAIGITERRHKARRGFVCFPYINRCILQAVADINNRRP
jgi:hypothetical protein